jgi:hypothetical protein
MNIYRKHPTNKNEKQSSPTWNPSPPETLVPATAAARRRAPLRRTCVPGPAWVATVGVEAARSSGVEAARPGGVEAARPGGVEVAIGPPCPRDAEKGGLPPA